MAQARVITNEDGRLYVTVRRGYHVEPVEGHHPEVRPGAKIEVTRARNNPYLRFVRAL